MSKRRTEASPEAATAVLAGSFVEMVGDSFALRDEHGEKVEFDLKPGRAVYSYQTDPRGWLHCYTPWKDTQGRFWVWSYKPMGKGSRSGIATDYELWHPRWFRSRSKAKKVAMDRLANGGGVANGRFRNQREG